MAKLSRKRKIKSNSMESFKEDKEYNSNALVFSIFRVFNKKVFAENIFDYASPCRILVPGFKQQVFI
jgi:hypothetical protein